MSKTESKIETFPVAVTRRHLGDLFITAMESGYSPWVRGAELVGIDVPRTRLDLIKAWGDACKVNPKLVWWGQDGLYDCEFTIALRYDREEDEEGSGRGTVHVRPADFLRGFSDLAKDSPVTFGSALLEGADGPTSDAWLQCVVFGKTVYA